MALFGPPGERIGYTVYDHPKDGPPLVLLHGFMASSAVWMEAIPRLRRDFTIITVDLLGHGESDAPAEEAAYSPERAVSRIDGLMDELGIDDAIFCGHSLGGALALRMAMERPGRVAGLVIINSNSAAGTEEWRTEAQAQLAAIATQVRSEGAGFLRTTRMYPARSRRLPEEARDALTRDFDRLTPDGVAGTAAALGAQVNAYELLGEMSKPTLVVVGDRDEDFVYAAPRLVAGLRKANVSIVTLENAGHLAQLEQPGALAIEIAAFGRQIDYLPRLSPAQRFRRPFLVGAGFAIGWMAIGWGAFTLVTADGSASTAPIPVSPTSTSTPRPTQSPPLATAPATASAGGAPSTEPAASVTPTPTASPTATTPSPTPTLQSSQQGQVLQTPTPTRAPSTPTPTATPTQEPTPTPTAEPPTPTPTPQPPTATPTPSGPTVGFAQAPGSAVVGESVTFIASASGGQVLRVEMSSAAGSVNASGVLRVAFAAPGCYPVTATAYFASGKVSTTTYVSVGGVAC